MPTNAINDTGVKYIYDKLHSEIEGCINDIEDIDDIITTDTSTIEGNPLNFSTLSAQTAESTIIDLEPIQDLHGYDKPWVGGAGKNLLPLTLEKLKTDNVGGTWNDNVYTFRGISFTVNTDNGGNVTNIVANGTADVDWANLVLYDFPIQAGQYILSGSIGGSSSTYRVAFNDSYACYNEPINVNLSESTVSRLQITIRKAGVTVNNVVFYPMLCLASASEPTVFEPYTNLCPITGRTQVGIDGCGKNLLPMTVEGIKATNTGGTWSGNVYTINGGTFTINVNNDGNIISITANGTFSSQTILNCTQSYAIDPTILKVGTYKFGCTSPLLSSTNRIRYRDPNGFFAIYSSVKERTYETDSWVECAIVIDAGTVSNLVFQPMIYFAIETDPTFEPYTESNDLTISLGQTVYGGTLDVENGVLVVEKAIDVFDGSSDEEWALYGTGSASAYCMQGKLSHNHAVVDYAEPFNGISNYLFAIPQGTTWGNYDGFVSGLYNTNLNTVYTGIKSITTVSAWETYLASNNLQVCYKLATPITINLTPNTINLLKGVNNISTDGDKITLTYRDGSVATLEDVKLASEDLEKQIADAQILTDTVTGDKYKLVITNGVLDIQQVSN